MEIKNLKRTIGKRYRDYCKVCGRDTMHLFTYEGLVCGQCQTRKKD